MARRSQSGSRPSIHVQNMQRKIRVNLARLEEFAERVLPICLALDPKKRTHGFPNEIFVLLVSDRRMAQLHRKFLETPGSTDVITFQHGEIFVSVETTRRNAARFGNSALREIELCIVHGLLHLRGFDDSAGEKAKVMHATQAKIMNQMPGKAQREIVRRLK
jgi:probable rRNA maturation factor